MKFNILSNITGKINEKFVRHLTLVTKL